MTSSAAGSIRVIVFGVFAEHWMSALAPEAPVWKQIEAVGEVVHVGESAAALGACLAKNDLTNFVLPLLPHHAKATPGDAAALISDPLAMDMLADKARFGEWMSAQGLGRFTPQTFPLGAPPSFPCVLKRTDLCAGHGVAIAESASHLRFLTLMPTWVDEPCILQAFVSGKSEFATHVICAQGRILWEHSFRYDRAGANPICGEQGVFTIAEVTTAPRALRVIATIVERLELSGPVCVDYKISQNRPIIFEINPRFGGSLMRPEKVGVLGAALSTLLGAAVNAAPRQRGD